MLILLLRCSALIFHVHYRRGNDLGMNKFKNLSPFDALMALKMKFREGSWLLVSNKKVYIFFWCYAVSRRSESPEIIIKFV